MLISTHCRYHLLIITKSRILFWLVCRAEWKLHSSSFVQDESTYSWWKWYILSLCLKNCNWFQSVIVGCHWQVEHFIIKTTEGWKKSSWSLNTFFSQHLQITSNESHLLMILDQIQFLFSCWPLKFYPAIVHSWSWTWLIIHIQYIQMPIGGSHAHQQKINSWSHP